jgi:hypothetical protein
MGLGKNRAIVGIYGRHQLVQFNNSPLVISLLAEEGSPTGSFFLSSPFLPIALISFFGSLLARNADRFGLWNLWCDKSNCEGLRAECKLKRNQNGKKKKRELFIITKERKKNGNIIMRMSNEGKEISSLLINTS